jgi:hypothetical protein
MWVVVTASTSRESCMISVLWYLRQLQFRFYYMLLDDKDDCTSSMVSAPPFLRLMNAV